MLEPSVLVGNEKFKSWRPRQEETIQNLIDSKERFKLLEAPTGSGKTLVGTAIHKLQNLYGTVYCCTTRKLQDQYMEDFGTFAVDVKGKSNYPCLLPGIEDASQCLDSQDFICGHKDSCPYRIRVEKARHAEMAVLNIWALLYQIKFAGRFTNDSWREDEPHRKLLILDEADTLEECLTSFASRQITSKYCKKYHLPLPDFEDESIDYWVSWMMETTQFLGGLIKRAPTEEVKNEHRVVEQNLKFLLGYLDNTWVVEEIEGGVSFVPTQISSLAQSCLFEHFEEVVLMSASFCGDNIYTKVMGINDYEYFEVPSYIPPHKRPIYFIPVASCLQQDEDKGSYEEIRKVIDIILGTYHEKTIIHTVSNSRAEQLVANSSFPISIYNSSDYHRVNIEEFLEGTVRILASPSLERGYDFRDDICRINIITKVPYPFWGSKSVQEKSRKHSKWYAWQAVQKIVQMTGRSTRNPNDYSLSFILDSAFKNSLIDKKGGGPLFPKWWAEAIKVIKVEDIKEELLEESKK